MGYEENLVIERNERKARTIAMRATFNEVCGFLGEGWTVAPTSNNADDDTRSIKIAHTDGRSIWIGWEYYNFKGKLEISGNFDYGDRDLQVSFPYKESRPSITVSLSRGAKTIASEIKRRLMPEYNRLHTLISEQVARATDYRDTRKGLCERLGKLAGATDHRISQEGFTAYRSEGPYIEAKVYRNYANLEIHSVNEAQATAIIKLVNGMLKAGN